MKHKSGFAKILLCMSAVILIFSNAESADSVDSLAERAREKKLYESPYWQVLVHYKKGWFGYNSEIDDPRFFLSPDGKTNPAGELDATIRKLFADGGSADAIRFTARYRWLVKELSPDGIRNEYLEKEADEVIRRFDPDRITVLFSDEHPGVIESAFGHSFLAVYKKNQTGENAVVLNYAGDMRKDPYYLVPFKGLFGGYKGYFTVQEYKSKVNGYGEKDRRSVWEYDLNLTRDESERVLLHLHELDTVYCDFFFLDENCSQKMLSLLQPARPGKKLSNPYLYLSPIETLMSLKKNGMVDDSKEPAVVYDSKVAEKVPPHLRHGYSKLSVSGGIVKRDSFAEISFLPLYNSMYDENPGMKPGFQLTAFSASVRYFSEERTVKAERLMLCDIFVMNMAKIEGTCFKFKMGADRFIPKEARPLAFHPVFGYGVFRNKTPLGIVYATVDADANVYRLNDKIHCDAGPGLFLGVSKSWLNVKTTIEGSGYIYPADKYEYLAKIQCINSIDLSRFFTVNLNGYAAKSRNSKPWEILAGANFFF